MTNKENINQNSNTGLTDERIRDEMLSYFSYMGKSENQMWANIDDILLFAKWIAAQSGQVDFPEDLERDAARYRWLRYDPPLKLAVRRISGDGYSTYLSGGLLDSTIDMVMKFHPLGEPK